MDERNGEWMSDKFSVFADPSLDDMEAPKEEGEGKKRVMVGKGNNSKLVSNYFAEREGFCLMGDKETFCPNFYFKWVQSAGEVDFYSFKEGQQLVNHIPNITVISSKLELLRTLRELEQDSVSKGYPLTLGID